MKAKGGGNDRQKVYIQAYKYLNDFFMVICGCSITKLEKINQCFVRHNQLNFSTDIFSLLQTKPI